MRNIMFATVFPHYHPKKGQQTNFVQKIWANPHIKPLNVAELIGLGNGLNNAFLAKGHTIRGGNGWKIGDYFKPCIWSGRPYNSKIIQIAEPTKVEKTWEISISKSDYTHAGIPLGYAFLKVIAGNDGLSLDDLEAWFAPYGKKETEECQIICWNKEINYFENAD